VQLTSELSRMTLNVGQPHHAPIGNGNGVHRSRMAAAAHDVIAALRELRDEADEAGKEPQPKVEVGS
jgi:hypothetical protein